MKKKIKKKTKVSAKKFPKKKKPIVKKKATKIKKKRMARKSKPILVLTKERFDNLMKRLRMA